MWKGEIPESFWREWIKVKWAEKEDTGSLNTKKVGKIRKVLTVILYVYNFVCNFVLIFPQQPTSLPAILACPVPIVPSEPHSHLLSPWISPWPLTSSVVSEHLSILLYERMFYRGIVLVVPGPKQWEVAIVKHYPSKFHSQQKHTHYKTRVCFMISVTIEEIAH